MRLNQIKLAGFKSFAEPTTFQLPGQLVGVVGPNGCGKSNIMDAVRWVLGESKASELRGESMQDVIFNGSGNRKPANRASVELVFDNAAARAGGQWNSFAEIAVKRTLTRDGASSYFINNQVVRRRDVQDVFLGTGLGPRAYAIIGQGTISRIIESKPEELRMFLEEAAGVSKYKERRRETELRLRHTRENLIRVEDILRELNSNLEKLEKQAAVATQYRSLQEQGTLKLHQLWFLKHRDASQEEERVKTAIAEAANALESRLAELRQTEAQGEQVRQAHYAANDQLHSRQGLLGEAALEVSRLEERIRYVVDGRRRAEQRLTELQTQNTQWAERQAAAGAELDDAAQQIATSEEQAELQHAQAEEQGAALPALEDALRQAQAESNRQRSDVSQVQQQIQVLAADSRNVEEQSRSLNTRRERLAAEQKGLQLPDMARLQTLQGQDAQASQASEVAEGRLHELQEEVPELDDRRRQAQASVNQEGSKLSDIGARLEALRALQAKVQTQGKLQPWLERHGLTGLQGLWTQVHIDTGWENALEAALRERLNALAVGKLDLVRAFADDAPPAKLAFYALQPGGGAIGSVASDATSDATSNAISNAISNATSDAISRAGSGDRGVGPAAPSLTRLPRLSGLLRLGDASLKALLLDWLEGVYTAASLEEALAQRGQLGHGEVIMTRQGHAVWSHAVAFYAPDSEQAGMLSRAQEIENLDRQQRAQTSIADETRATSVRLEAAYTDASQRLLQARRDAAEAKNRAHGLQVEVLRLSQLAEAASSRQSQLGDELGEIDVQLESLQERRATSEARFEELDMALADTQQRHAELDDVVIEAERKLAEAREQQRGLERQAQEMSFQARSLKSRQGELQRSIETAVGQMASNTQTGEQLQLELGSFDDAAAQSGLQAALALKLERERHLGLARSEYDDLSSQLRAAEERKLSFERSLEPLRENIGKLQLELQAAQLGGAQFIEQLTAAEVDLQALAQGIADNDVKLWGLQTEIDRIQKEVNVLGAVNLAALDELSSSRERKTFLDAQNADLQEAISTLEGAIHKIDLETRELLVNTFNHVNEHFGRMFPSLFGGGTAKLMMTGTEVLDAGVQVMAQPPGKKNSTIHLLSGGEKALTAIALVFAIFQLNPAPFCLLDEVDAPLDDANTDRYRKLVTEMSKATQFLFISHNKIAMEMAEQLIGVTMQEQGVSRIVAVDMEAALGMAEVV